MIASKLVEAAFRRWWLLIIPIVTVPAIIFLLASEEPEYRSAATVWVARVDSIDGGPFTRGSNPYLTPAQAQVQITQDLLATQSFRQAVAIRAGLDSKYGELVVADSVAVYPAGTNLVSIGATRPSAQAAQALAIAALDEYRLRAAEETKRQASAAINYYSTQLVPGRAELDKRRAALAEYLTTNPRAAENRFDVTYPRLSDAVLSQSTLVSQMEDAMQAAERSALTVEQGVDATFSIQDQPPLPEAALPVALTKRLGYPAAGLLFGVILAACYTYLVFRSDHTIRSSQDLQSLSVTVLTYVPELSPRPRLISKVDPRLLLPRWRQPNYARKVAHAIAVVSASDGASK